MKLSATGNKFTTGDTTYFVGANFGTNAEIFSAKVISVARDGRVAFVLNAKKRPVYFGDTVFATFSEARKAMLASLAAELVTIRNESRHNVAQNREQMRNARAVTSAKPMKSALRR